MYRTCFTSAGLLLTPMFLLSQERASEKSECTVEITSPRNGDKVKKDDKNATGNAQGTDGNKYLWIFAHRQGLAMWWPQGGGAVKPNDRGEWIVTSKYGVDSDQGSQFEVLALVVDGKTNAELEASAEKAAATYAETGIYPGGRLPQQYACSSKIVIVTRR